jgi:hypothetical protein
MLFYCFIILTFYFEDTFEEVFDEDDDTISSGGSFKYSVIGPKVKA